MDNASPSTVYEDRVAAMGKSKHAKSLTHEEIWDDSALVRSWDEAVEEYQLYHSIHAKGENVEDVLREGEAAGLAEVGEVLDQVESVAQNVAMEVESEEAAVPFDETAPDSTPQVASTVTEAPQQSSAEGPNPATAPEPTFPAGTMPMPQPVLSNVQDENLKRLMMAWYFAGYYTGLYEGQQQAGQGKS